MRAASLLAITAVVSLGTHATWANEAGILIAAERHGLPASLVKAVVQVESGGNARARSPRGAMGLMQLMPETASRFGVSDPFDPAQSLEGGCAYLRWLLDRFDGSVELALAGYNAGEGAVERYAGIPPFAETVAYVRNVLLLAGGTLERPERRTTSTSLVSLAPAAGASSIVAGGAR